jgi:hypothetical protein
VIEVAGAAASIGEQDERFSGSIERAFETRLSNSDDATLHRCRIRFDHYAVVVAAGFRQSTQSSRRTSKPRLR